MNPIRSAPLTDNTILPKVADRLKAELEAKDGQLDIVTGYLAPSAFAVLASVLDRARPTRILLGKDYQLEALSRERQEADIQALVAEALRTASIPERLPTPDQASEVTQALDFLRRDDVELKVWTDGFLHAKAYILPDTVGVGSANLTAGGLLHNRELVMWREDRSVVDELRHWFERYWEDEVAVDAKARLIETLERTAFGGFEFTPYQVLIRALASRYGVERPPSLEAATFQLRWFQEDAVFRLIRMIDHGAHGALLADAVGLGKTYMALGVIHHFLYRSTRGVGSGPPVLILVPASMAPIWNEVLEQYGLAWACRVVNLQRLSSDADVRGYQGASLVVIDEAHRLRGGGVWFRRVLEILTQGTPDKRVLLLTATPINTGIVDLTRLLRVLTKNRRNVYAPAIADFESYLKRVERGEVDPYPILDRSIVRRSRSDILREYEERRAAGMVGIERPRLPRRSLHHVTYSYTEDGGDDLFATFDRTLRELRLAPFDLRPYHRREGQLHLLASGEGPAFPAGSLAPLVAAGLLKRFESSLRAIALSLRRLEIVLGRSAQALSMDPPRLLDLSKSPIVKRLIDDEREADEDDDGEEGDLDHRWQEALASLQPLQDPGDYDLAAVRKAIDQDLEAIRTLRSALPSEVSDGKVAALRKLFAPGGLLHGKRALVFTQYRDTAIYIHERLDSGEWRQHAGVGPVALIHGGTPPAKRLEVVATFDPKKVAALELERRWASEEIPQILVSTDVLAEGHNLQMAEAVVNVDLHWNPQVVVQRCGRIDRLDSPHEKVLLVSFLPEEGLDAHLGLVQALDQRFRLIHVLGLGDEPVTKLPGDRVTITFAEMRRLYGDDPTVLDEIERTWTLGSTDYMRAPLEAFLIRHAAEKLKEIPLGVQSVKRLPDGWRHGPGAFVAFAYQDESIWRFYPRQPGGWGPALTDEAEIFRAIVCSESEPRASLAEPFPGPGGVIDWTLLRRAAEEVAEELTRRRATAALQRGASERSRKLRLRLHDLGDLVGEVPGLDQLLDRLEQVRIEDFDHRAGYAPFLERVRAAERASTAGERHDLLIDAVRRGLELLGPPEDADADEVEIVEPRGLQLVAWEVLVERDYQPADVPTQLQLT
ncbi:MAG TPA: helicase-related protein [Candidatus Dormibacteraeota bacterium]|nr:helicase-related protein [Candidatus Dormibacteraeota bacterium]